MQDRPLGLACLDLTGRQTSDGPCDPSAGHRTPGAGLLPTGDLFYQFFFRSLIICEAQVSMTEEKRQILARNPL